MITPTDGRVTSPCIRPNPDISGVGIRLSVYGQVFLNVAFALIFPPNATISHSEYTALAISSRNLCLTGCALLICAFYQASVQGLTVHHTLIVLNLNWIIYLSTLPYILIRSCQAISRSRPIHPATATPPHTPILEGNQALSNGDSVPVWQLVILPAAHLSALGFLGILLWTQVETFGDQSECTTLTVLTVFGSSLRVLDETIRRGSMAIYWIVAIPLLNVLVTSAAAFVAPAVMTLLFWTAGRVVGRQLRPWNVFAPWCGIATISVLLVLFISNTELMIARGVHTALVGAGEEEWTFGQTLAVITLLVQMAEMVKVVSSWRADRGGGR